MGYVLPIVAVAFGLFVLVWVFKRAFFVNMRSPKK
jgi:hypothetical protein